MRDNFVGFSPSMRDFGRFCFFNLKIVTPLMTQLPLPTTISALKAQNNPAQGKRSGALGNVTS